MNIFKSILTSKKVEVPLVNITFGIQMVSVKI